MVRGRDVGKTVWKCIVAFAFVLPAMAARASEKRCLASFQTLSTPEIVASSPQYLTAPPGRFSDDQIQRLKGLQGSRNLQGLLELLAEVFPRLAVNGDLPLYESKTSSPPLTEDGQITQAGIRGQLLVQPEDPFRAIVCATGGTGCEESPDFIHFYVDPRATKATDVNDGSTGEPQIVEFYLAGAQPNSVGVLIDHGPAPEWGASGGRSYQEILISLTPKREVARVMVRVGSDRGLRFFWKTWVFLPYPP
jgi:hypothetical protein